MATQQRKTTVQKPTRAKRGEVKEPVLHFLEEHRGEKLSIKEIAEAVGFTESKARQGIASVRLTHDVASYGTTHIRFEGVRGGEARDKTVVSSQALPDVPMPDALFPEYVPASQQAKDHATKRLTLVVQQWNKVRDTELSREDVQRLNDALNSARNALGIPYEEFE